MFQQSVALMRRHLVLIGALLAVVATVTPGIVSRAADPTDAAGVLTAVSGVFTAFPILTVAVTVFAIAGVAMYLVRRGAKVTR